jgi:hypothetical protein
VPKGTRNTNCGASSGQMPPGFAIGIDDRRAL